MLLIYAVVMLIFCCGMVLVASCVCFPRAAYNRGNKADVIILLGYPANNDGSIPPILRERINRAVELFHSGIAGIIICSGAAVANNHIEADVMAHALNEFRIPDDCIIRERLARGTYENLRNSKEIMENMKFNSAVIVSSPWHLRKASSYAFELGIDHTVERSKYPPEYPIISIAVIYLYIYGQMLINRFKHRQPKDRKTS